MAHPNKKTFKTDKSLISNDLSVFCCVFFHGFLMVFLHEKKVGHKPDPFYYLSQIHPY